MVEVGKNNTSAALICAEKHNPTKKRNSGQTET